MNRLSIPFLSPDSGQWIEDISARLDRYPRNRLDHLLWLHPSIRPEVAFAIAFDRSNLFLKFYVKEPYVQALHWQTNSPVYRDSCVEFFVGIGEEENYYNFEFNCIGTCLAQFGPNRQNRHFISSLILKDIRSHSQFGRPAGDGLHTWELCIQIPNSVFFYHIGYPIYKNDLRVNFYKCGDDLEEKHYLAWNEVQTETPDFHLPFYFGSARFEMPDR